MHKIRHYSHMNKNDQDVGTNQGRCSDRETPVGVAMLDLKNKTFCSRWSPSQVGSENYEKIEDSLVL